MSNNRMKIIGDLTRDTDNDKIEWDVTIESDYIKAIYNMPVTANKTIVFKLVYFTNNPKVSKLNVLYVLNIDDKKFTRTINDIGGKSKKAEVKEISYLINRILLKEEENRG